MDINKIMTIKKIAKYECDSTKLTFWQVWEKFSGSQSERGSCAK